MKLKQINQKVFVIIYTLQKYKYKIMLNKSKANIHLKIPNLKQGKYIDLNYFKNQYKKYTQQDKQ